jgi:hypothetical protein
MNYKDLKDHFTSIELGQLTILILLLMLMIHQCQQPSEETLKRICIYEANNE